MEREHDTAVIELGAVTVETQGPVGPYVDAELGTLIPGLNDD